MVASGWKPTYDLYRTRSDADARCEKMRRAGFACKVRRVAKSAGKGSLVLNPKYTVDYREPKR